MKIQAYQWNGKVTTNRWEMTSISILVTTRMIESVMKKSGTKKWEINHVGEQFLSNKNRNCAVMTYRNTVNFIHDILKNLGIDWVESSQVVDYYRRDLEVSRDSYQEPKYIMFNAADRKTSLTTNTPFVVKGIQSRGTGQTRHIIARRIT